MLAQFQYQIYGILINQWQIQLRHQVQFDIDGEPAQQRHHHQQRDRERFPIREAQ